MAANYHRYQEYLHIPNRISATSTRVVRVLGTTPSRYLIRLVDIFLFHAYGRTRPYTLVRSHGVLYATLNNTRDASMLDRRIYLVDGAVVGFVAVHEDAPFEAVHGPCYIRLY